MTTLTVILSPVTRCSSDQRRVGAAPIVSHVGVAYNLLIQLLLARLYGRVRPKHPDYGNELLLYSFSVVCREHFMRYYDHFMLTQGGFLT